MRFAWTVTHPRALRQMPPNEPPFTGLTVILGRWGGTQARWVEHAFAEGVRLGLQPQMLRFSGYEPDLSSVEETERREAVRVLAEVIGLAERIGVPQVCVPPGGEVYEDEDRQPRLTALLRSLNELWKRASQKGRDLMLEVPVPGHLGETGEEIESVLRLADADLGLCYDVTASVAPLGVRAAVRHLRVAVTEEAELLTLRDDLSQLAADWFDGPVTVESMFARG